MRGSSEVQKGITPGMWEIFKRRAINTINSLTWEEIEEAEEEFNQGHKRKFGEIVPIFNGKDSGSIIIRYRRKGK